MESALHLGCSRGADVRPAAGRWNVRGVAAPQTREETSPMYTEYTESTDDSK
jgi:hypothetical protein